MGRALPVDESVRGRPAPGLLPYIAEYSGYRQAGITPAVHLGLPSPELTLIFTLDDPLCLAAHPDPRQPASAYDSLAGGLHTSPALITHDGSQSGIQLRVSPLGSRALLGVPAGELAGLDLQAAELLGQLDAEIRERLLAEATWPGRFAVLDQMLLPLIASGAVGTGTAASRRGSSLAARAEVSPEVRHAWRLLLRSGGALQVSELAEHTGWSERHLRTAFRTETGLTPKAAARVIRFNRARRMLQQRAEQGRPLALAGLAADCGYYDQAHLAREFRELAGCPPSEWVAAECRNVQAPAAVLVAASKA
jgi:AraC-like DNA-binding protein